MTDKRITANGIHHLVKGAEHDKDPKIRDVLEPQGFSVLELSERPHPYEYMIKISHPTGIERHVGNFESRDSSLAELGTVAAIQHFLQTRHMYLSRAVFSTSVDGNPQVSGNRYKDRD